MTDDIAKKALMDIRNNPNHTPLRLDPSKFIVEHTYNHPVNLHMEYNDLFEQFIAPVIFPGDTIKFTSGYAPEYDFEHQGYLYEIKTTGDQNQQIFIECSRESGKKTGLDTTQADFYVILHRTCTKHKGKVKDVIKVQIIATATLKHCRTFAEPVKKYTDNPAHGFNISLNKDSICTHIWWGDFDTDNCEHWDLSTRWRTNANFQSSLNRMKHLVVNKKTPLKSNFSDVVICQTM